MNTLLAQNDATDDDEHNANNILTKKCRACGRAKRVTVHDHLSLDPWQKWKKYRRVPWKFFIQLSLLVGTTAQVVMVVNKDASYIRSRTDTFTDLFIPPQADTDMMNVADYTRALLILGNSLSTFTETAIDYYEVLGKVNGTTHLSLELVSYSDDLAAIYNPTEEAFSGTTFTAVYAVNASDPLIGTPFDTQNQTALQEFFFLLKSMTVSFTLRGVPIVNGERSCLIWDISIVLFGDSDYFQPFLTAETSPCGEAVWYTPLQEPLGIVTVIVFLLAILNEILIFKAIFVNVKIYGMVRRELNSATGRKSKLYHFFVASVERENISQTWKTMGISEKLRFFNRWFVVNFLGNICQVAAACILVLSNDGSKSRITGNVLRMLLGFGAAAAWLAIVRYLEYSRKNYRLIHTLKQAASPLGRFLFCGIFFFMAYTVFGVAYFSIYSSKFANLDIASVALFAVMNGDIVFETFGNIYASQPFLSRIYLYSYISLFIYFVLNVCIVIVEDSYWNALKEEGGLRVNHPSSVDNKAQDSIEKTVEPRHPPTYGTFEQQTDELSVDRDEEANVTEERRLYRQHSMFGDLLKKMRKQRGRGSMARPKSRLRTLTKGEFKKVSRKYKSVQADSSPGSDRAEAVCTCGYVG